MRRAAAVLSLLLAALGAVLMTAGPSMAATAHLKPRLEAYRYARDHRGDPYEWGAAGPSAFDCSGLVYAAYLNAGKNIGRDTFDMLADGAIRPVSHPKKGDLAFFGSGHVEMFVHRHWTIGAHESGTVISYQRWYPGSGYEPTMYFRVRGAGIGSR